MMPRLARLVAAGLVWAGLSFTAAQAQDDLRIVMVTHGGPTSPFWAIIKEGAESAAEMAGVEFAYRSPATFDLEAMAALITEAIAEEPAGLIVSIPNADAVAAPIRAARDAGIPVVSINSGFDVSRSLGALLHVGQGEYEAGRVAGEAMRARGGTQALCLNHELGNVALDLRCKGFIDGFGGSVEVLPVGDDAEAAKTIIGEALAADAAIDVVLALSASSAGEPAVAAVEALEEARTVHVGSFDISDALLAAVADGKASFAIDQQPFLQGYLPVQFLVLHLRHGVMPVANVSTGPKLVEAEEAARRLGRAASTEPEDEGTGLPEAPADLEGG
jgi:simple sugar transport system substrate-binding protein